MNLLHVSSAFYPATYWGGPIYSTYALCNGVASHVDTVLRVLTVDGAGPSVHDRVFVPNTPVVYPPGYEVYFVRRRAGRDIAPGLLAKLMPMVRWADVVHLTGNYNFPCLPTLIACRLLSRPLVWSPRGTLQATEEWRAVRRRGSKNVFDALLRCTLPGRTIMHVTSEMERLASQKRIPGLPVVVIPNGVDVPDAPAARLWRPQGRLRLMFISRLDPKKGLENLLHAMATLQGDVTLDIYGTGQADYVERAQRLARDLGLSPRVTFHGHVDGDAKARAFHSADLFVLPSYSENFGIVVAEALAHGVPVITSRATPWSEIEAMDCGRWIDNAPEAVAQAIRETIARDLEAMGRRGREWVASEFGWQRLSDRMVGVYQSLARTPTRASRMIGRD